ncbi:hypothetical protein PtA15_5A63, partial [Puccinia triticina]
DLAWSHPIRLRPSQHLRLVAPVIPSIFGWSYLPRNLSGRQHSQNFVWSYPIQIPETLSGLRSPDYLCLVVHSETLGPAVAISFQISNLPVHLGHTIYLLRIARNSTRAAR